jgi:hypothetical protein
MHTYMHTSIYIYIHTHTRLLKDTTTAFLQIVYIRIERYEMTSVSGFRQGEVI